jgi:hypothetical protein
MNRLGHSNSADHRIAVHERARNSGNHPRTTVLLGGVPQALAVVASAPLLGDGGVHPGTLGPRPVDPELLQQAPQCATREGTLLTHAQSRSPRFAGSENEHRRQQAD